MRPLHYFCSTGGKVGNEAPERSTEVNTISLRLNASENPFQRDIQTFHGD